MHYKTKIILAVGVVLLLMAVSFTAGVTATNPFVYLVFSENEQFFIILSLFLVATGLVIALWQHKFLPIFSGFVLALVLPLVIFCSLIIYSVTSDVISNLMSH